MKPVSLKLALWLAAAAWLFAVAPVGAAVQLDSTSSAEDNTDTLTWSHTVASGSDRYLVVGVSIRRSDTTADTVTYGGVSMTELGVEINGNVRVYLFGLDDPATGTADVEVSLSRNARVVGGASSFSGVDGASTTSDPSFASESGNDATPSVTVCPSAGGNCPAEAGDLAVSVLSTRGNAGAVSPDPIVPDDITFDAASEDEGTNIGSISWSHTIGGANVRKLFVGVAVEEPGDCDPAGDADVTDVTYASVSLTHVPSADACSTNDDGGGDFAQRIELWYMDETDLPAAGTHTVAVTFAGTVNEANTGAVSLEAAAPGDPEDVATSVDNVTDDITTPIGAGTAGAWLLDLAGGGDPGSFAPGGGQVERTDASASSATGAMSTKADVTAAANSMSQTHSDGATNRLAHSVARIAPYCGAGCASAGLWNDRTGNARRDAVGAASASGGAGSITLSWNLQSGRNWALGAVLLKDASVSTRAQVAGMRSWRGDGDGALIEWTTLSEHGTAGYHLKRWDEDEARWKRVNRKLVPAMLHARAGGTYRVEDPAVSPGSVHRYRLVEIEVTGRRLRYGPFEVAIEDAAPPALTGDSPVHGVERAALEAGRARAGRARETRRAIGKARRAGRWAKITTTSAGIHRVGATQVADALGMSARAASEAIAEGRLRLLNRGAPVATRAVVTPAGERAIEFHAEAVQSPYTVENVYRLERGAALAMRVRASRGEPAPVTPGTFLERIRAEGARYSLTHLFEDPDDDYWMWDFRIGGLDLPACAEPAARGCYLDGFGVSAPGLDTASSARARLTVAFHGGSATDHEVTVHLNDAEIGTVGWSDVVPHAHTFDVPVGDLVAGENTVRIAARASADPQMPSIVYLDEIDLEYPRRMLATDGSLRARTHGDRTVTVAGFTGEALTVLDLARPRRPRIVESQTTSVGSGHAATFATGGRDFPFVAYQGDAVHAPASVAAGTAAGLRARANRAEHLTITVAPLVASAERLAAHRRGQGMSAMVVDVERIFDEFGHGLRDPDAIWRFLRHAHGRWRTPPRYVLLAGDASFDYADHLGHGESLVPTLLAPTPDGLFASDNLFADVEGADRLAEFAVGRAPVVSAAELDALIDKLIAFEAHRPPAAAPTLLVADAPDAGGEFPADSEAVARAIPPGVPVERIHLDLLSRDEAAARLRAGIASGAPYVNFIGHSGPNELGNAGLLSVWDVPQLGNAATPFVLTAQSCLVARFAMPGLDSLGEALVLGPSGGAMAVWGPSGLSFNDSARHLGQAFHRRVRGRGEQVLGDVLLAARREFAARGADAYLLDTYNLIGFPALRLH